MPKIGLLMYACDYYQGGLWRYAYNLSKQLLVLDKQNTYTFIHAKEKPENFLGLENQERLMPFFGRDKIFHLPKVLNTGEYSVIHQTENSCPWFPKETKYKKIITIHDLTPYKFPQYFSARDFVYYRFFLPRALKKVNVIICPSQNTKQELVRFYKIDPKIIYVIYDGIEDKFFQAVKEEVKQAFLTERGITKPYIMTLGVNYHRNLGTLFKAYNSLPEALKTKYDLLVFGYTGLETGEALRFLGRGSRQIFQQANGMSGSQGKIRFVGKVTEQDLVMYYKSASVFVFPSLSEGFGFPPLEAMASGVPVISSSATAMKETVGEAGVLVDPKDIRGFTEAITKVLNSKNLQQELTEKGFRRALRFTWKQCAQEHIDVYNHV